MAIGGETKAGTGIAAFNDILNGGFTRGHMYLFEGEPGAGKTTLALQFLLDGAKAGESVLHITLSESEDEVQRVAKSHGWDMSKVQIMELGSLDSRHALDDQYTVFDPADVELSGVLSRLREHVERLKPKRIVVDSLSEVKLLARDPLRFRREILVLKQYFLEHNATVLLLDDLVIDHEETEVQSLVHGVVRLERLATELGAERRRLSVTKMRASRYRGGFHDYRIVTGGLEIYPRLVASEHRTEFLSGEILSGVDNLDELLGGGIERGTSTLVLGPAGTGKSTIVTTYALAFAKNGAKAAMFMFDENLGTLFARSKGIGLPLEEAYRDGSISLQQIDPAEMSPGEFIQIVRDSVEKDGVGVVIIDSLIGLINAMPEEKMLLTQLHELLSYLNQMGVTTLMTMVQHGLLGNMSNPADLSYLADTLLLLRYFEFEGEVCQAISVLKKRTGPHERTIRQVKVAQGGVEVGKPLRDFHGVLTGVPQYVGKSSPLMESRE